MVSTLVSQVGLTVGVGGGGFSGGGGGAMWSGDGSYISPLSGVSSATLVFADAHVIIVGCERERR